MSVTVLTAASTFRLTTLAAVMAEISLADQLIFAESLIDQASAAVARYRGTIFAQQKYREIHIGGYRTTALFLRYWPLVTVTPVSHGTTAITDYRIDSAEAGMLYRRDGWSLSCWSDEEWTVDYVAGYVLPDQIAPVVPLGPLLPDDIQRAVLETTKVWFNERLVDQRIQSRTLGDQKIDYGIQSLKRGIPVLAKDLLSAWRRLRVA